MSRPMDAGGSPSGFPVARCVACARDVLTHLTIDGRGREERCCVHCDAAIDPLEVRWIADPELGDLGYAVEEAARGCGSGGCGTGRCGRA